MLKNLDLFVAVSNSTTHLAGAIGVPTFLIKPPNHATFHYWNQISNRTPWYGSIKLYDGSKNTDKIVEVIKIDLLKKFVLN